MMIDFNPDFRTYKFPEHMIDVYNALRGHNLLLDMYNDHDITYANYECIYPDLKLQYSDFQLQYILQEINSCLHSGVK